MFQIQQANQLSVATPQQSEEDDQSFVDDQTLKQLSYDHGRESMKQEQQDSGEMAKSE